MNTMFHRCPRYSVRSVHLRPLLLENFLTFWRLAGTALLHTANVDLDTVHELIP